MLNIGSFYRKIGQLKEVATEKKGGGKENVNDPLNLIIFELSLSFSKFL